MGDTQQSDRDLRTHRGSVVLREWGDTWQPFGPGAE